MKFIIALCSLLCCVPSVMGQTVSQNQVFIKGQALGNASSPTLPLVQLQSIYMLPPIPAIQPQSVTAAIELPPPAAADACSGRLDIPKVSAGPLKLTAAKGLKGQTTGDPKF